MCPLVFVDTETTHLDPAIGEVYEIAMTRVDDTEGSGPVSNKDFWIEPLRLHQATSSALKIGRFYERRHLAAQRKHVAGSYILDEGKRVEAAIEIARFTEGCHLVGAKPDFDAGFLNAFLRANGACPAWHHRLIDVESLAIGVLVGEDTTWGRPQSLSDLCEVLEITRDGHEARGDCNAVREVYFKLMEMAEQRLRLWEKA